MKILALALMLLVIGCKRDEQLPEQPGQVAAQVQVWVPVGTSLVDARRIMEQHHFNCSVVKNSSFGDLKAADFLYCDRRIADESVTPMVVRRWQVALILDDGKIKSMRVSAGLIGP